MYLRGLEGEDVSVGDEYDDYFIEDDIQTKADEKEKYRQLIECGLVRQFLARCMVPRTIEFVDSLIEDGEKVIIIEDVMTSGKALREILPKIAAAASVNIVGMIISVDRNEKALDSEKSAVRQAKEEYGVDVYSVVTMNDIILAIEEGVIDGKEHLPAMYEYRATYGAKE
jgi:hypothetical protein